MTFGNVKKGDIISYVYNNEVMNRVFVDTEQIEEVKTHDYGIVIKAVVFNTTNPDCKIIGHHDIFNIPSEFKNSTEYNNIFTFN